MIIIFFSPDLDFMDLIGEDRQWMLGRKLMQVNDTLTLEDTDLQSSKNCTEPGNLTAALWVVLLFSLLLAKEELGAMFFFL